jgi:glutathione synthase/RimK-type ligase-like ATP-grasp enzyme
LKNSRIGIIGRYDDPQVEILKRRVEDLGAAAAIIDFWHLPKFSKTFIGDDAVVYDGIDLTALDAFYLRQLGYFSPLPQKQFTKEEWAAHFERFNDYMTNEREVLSFKESVIQILSELKPVVNPYRTAFFHKLKAYQYRVLGMNGLTVPDFIAGNEFFKMREFLAAGDSVIKPMTGGLVDEYGTADLERDREVLRQRPVMLQRRIRGRMLRSFVVGDRLIGTCEIVSGEADADSRRNITGMVPFALTAEQASIPVKACKVLGMVFAGVDLLLEAKSQTLYVLECNPSPLFRSFEAQTGLAISDSLAAYLVEEA